MGVLASVAAALAVSFSQHAGHYVVQTPGYRLVLSAQTGRILELDDARGRKLLGGSYGCLWWANPGHNATSLNGCSFHPTVRWNARASTLTLQYRTLVTVTLQARARSFD